MIKECQVILNNEAVSVVKFDDVEVQIPSVGKDTKTVCIKFDNGKYSVVDHTESEYEEEILTESAEVKEPAEAENKKETIKMKKRINANEQ